MLVSGGLRRDFGMAESDCGWAADAAFTTLGPFLDAWPIFWFDCSAPQAVPRVAREDRLLVYYRHDEKPRTSGAIPQEQFG